MDACPDLVGDNAYGQGPKWNCTTFGRLLQQLWEQHVQEVGALQAEVRRLCFQDVGTRFTNEANCSETLSLHRRMSIFGHGNGTDVERRGRVSHRAVPAVQAVHVERESRSHPPESSQAASSTESQSSPMTLGPSASARRTTWKHSGDLHEVHEEWQMRTETSGGQDKFIASVVSQAMKHERLQSRVEARRTVQVVETQKSWKSWARSGSSVEALNQLTRSTKHISIKLLYQLLLLAPSGRRRMTWDVLGIISLIFDLAWIPMQVFEPPRDATVRAIEYVVLGYWSLDLIANFLTGYYSKDGKLVMEPSKIAMRYVKSWLLLDCIIISSDYAATLLDHVLAQSHDAQGAGLARVARMSRMTRALRAMRLLRLLKVREIIHMIQEHIESEALLILYGMLQNILVLVVLAHLLACIWFWIGTGSHYSDTWILHIGLEDEYWNYQYAVALSWSLTQFTPASGDIFARNLAERSFFVGVLLISMIFFSSFVGSITSGMTRLRGLKSNKLTQQYMLRKFLSENRISRDLSARIARYTELAFELHQRKTDRSKVELLVYLSGPLEVEMQRELFEPYLLLNTFFLNYKEKSVAALNQLCSSAVQKLSFSKGDRIFDGATEASHMFILTSGTLVYRPIEGLRGCRKLALVRSGQSFGEAVLWLPWYHAGTMIAAIESEVMALSSVKFRNVTLAHPSVFMLACKHARQFVAELKNEMYEKKRHVFDLPQEIMYRTGAGNTSRRVSARVTDQDFLEEEILAEYMVEEDEETDDEDEDDTPGILSQSNIESTTTEEGASVLSTPRWRPPAAVPRFADDVVAEERGAAGSSALAKVEEEQPPPSPSTATGAQDAAPKAAREAAASDAEEGEGARGGLRLSTKLAL